jgi:hypothetical protein
MTTDVKFGMVVGLAVVLAVAVTYYSKGPPAPAPAPAAQAARAGGVVPTSPGAGAHAAGAKPPSTR